MLKNTLAFYTNFLTDVGFKIEEDNSISKYIRGSKGVSFKPVKTEGVPLVMGTQEILDSEDNDNVIYHPLTEDALKGESWTIKVTKDQINAMIRMRLLKSLIGLGSAIVEKRNAKITPKQTKLFNQNPDFDDKALAVLGSILSKAKASVVSRHVVGIYLHSKNCKYDGHDVKRLASVTSPLYDILDNGEKEIWGVKNVSFKAQRAIKQLISTVLPGVNDDQYTYGSNSKTAPYFDALANAFLNLSYQLDSIEKTCKTLFNDELSITPTYEWVDGLTQLAKLAMPIPPLRGNLGNDIIGQAAFSVPNGRGKGIDESKPSSNTATSNVPSNTPTQPQPTESSHPLFNNNQVASSPMPTSSPMMPSSQPAQSAHPLFANNQTVTPQVSSPMMPGQSGNGDLF
ncbi:hypothetical protein TSMG0153 [Halocynthia phage JM-2012]|uniref:hypothetical protein n=1 Tax=Halocynthia phage JM-2012 TaxID=1173297 RepID=UPI00025C6975|nr:hypothetical protein TSMG0153 [Halocynthia phage JM-2012]AFI55436.1 hypothetical protein TSMG0153 [Halocynthia phage JM-2012]